MGQLFVFTQNMNDAPLDLNTKQKDSFICI